MGYSLLTSFTVRCLFCCMTDDMIHVYPFFFALEGDLTDFLSNEAIRPDELM